MLTFLITACGSSDEQSTPGGGGGHGNTTRPFVTPVCETPDASDGFHVTVDGTAEGDGSLESPWDLATALLAPPGVGPGDTLWIHEGVYEGPQTVKLDGTESAPITVRNWPGDRVTLDSNDASEPVLQVYHSWTVIQNLELTNSHTDRRAERATGIWAGGENNSFRNLVVHDVGVGISGGQLSDGVQDGINTELYGTLFYNNGYLLEDRGHGHHLYLTNRDGTTTIEDNVLFSAYSFGCHLYSDTDRNYVQGFNVLGNAWFLNGAPGGKLVDGCLIGHNGSYPVKDILLDHNYGWAPTLDSRGLRLGWSAPLNDDATLTNNYLVGQTIVQTEWKSLSISGNQFIGSVTGLDSEEYPDNEYLSERPTTNHVIIRPNRYEPGRAHVIVYNWEELERVAIDPSDVMPAGTEYVLRNSQDYFGEPVLEGTYQGGELLVPMTGLTATLPLGETERLDDAMVTGNAFAVFVLQSAVCE